MRFEINFGAYDCVKCFSVDLFLLEDSSTLVFHTRKEQETLKLDVNNIFQCDPICNRNLKNLTDEITRQHLRLFDEPGLGTIKNFNASHHLKKDSTPKFSKTRSIPYSPDHKMKEDMNILVKKGFIEQVETSELTFPIGRLPKTNGLLRICKDFRAGLNSQLDIE
ncbi:hypothetical protein RF11_08070 [Thelohanellus kitauei]|uniref:Uncharacterized protein n=1 Tax=Thelohanellus kitauei TaxID=669202 RepID=A0A0C2I8N5_THEKT|nr:hypothetical protein RF11_08070 [Thelohanellus kitauei]